MMGTLKLWEKWRNCLRNFVMKYLYQMNRIIGRATMVNLQSPLVSDDCRPDVLTGQSLVHFPVLIQQRDQSFLIYLANKMKAPCGNRQPGRQSANLSGCYPMTLNPFLRLRWRQTTQGPRLVLLRIPLLKFGAGAFDCCRRIEMAPPPKALAPQTIGSFEQSIPLCLVGREEDRLNPDTQTQADEPTKDARRFVTAAKSRVVVHLQSIGQAQLTPCFKRVALDAVQTLIGANRLMQRASLQIERVKGKDLATASEELRGPIHGVQDIIRRGGGLRKINFPRRTRRFDQSRFAQDSLDGRVRRDSSQQPRSPQFSLNRFRTDQSDFAPFQSPASLNHQTPGSPVVAMYNCMWAARFTSESFPAQIVKALFPFRKPSTTSSKAFENDARFQTIQHPTDRFATKTAFFFLVHDASLSGSMDNLFTML